MLNTNDELLTRINTIRESIITHVDIIRMDIKLILTENQNELTLKLLDDIKKIDENCLYIKESIASMLSSEKILTHTGDHGEYLLRIRHNMHNSINIIQGYTEILLMEFQKTRALDLTKKFTSILSIIQEILRLTNDIKLAHPDELEQPAIIDFNLDIEIPEYSQFKETMEILVVDDIQENCTILEQYLQFMGFKKITIANDGVEAMQKLQKTKFDIVLLDLDMPRMTGKEVLIKMRDIIVKGSVAVLVVSGYDSMEKNIECIKLGAVDLITKPFNKDLLRVRINTLIEKKWLVYKEAMYQLKINKIIGHLKKGYYLLYVLVLLSKL